MVAEYCNREGGEVRPKRPTLGKAKPGMTFSRGGTSRHIEAQVGVNSVLTEGVKGQPSHAPERERRSLWFVIGEGHRLAADND